MAKKNIKFTVTPDKGTQSFWIAVDESDVVLAGGSGSMQLAANVAHFLTWGFTGNPGGTLSIVGKDGGSTVVEVKQSTIPPGRIRAAGVRLFSFT